MTKENHHKDPAIFCTSISTLAYNSKPEKSQIGSITNSFLCKETNIKDLAEKISKGHTFAPAIFKNNNRTNDNFLSTQVFALDFDDNQDPEEKIKIFASYNIKVNILYYSFSHTIEHKKFRLVFVFDTVINDRKIRDKIQIAFMQIANDSDKSCKDAARMFYGTDKKVEIREKCLNSFENLLVTIDALINANVSAPTKRQNTEKLKNFQNNATLINIYKGCVKMKENDNKHIIRNYNFDEARKVSTVLNDFAVGKNLKYNQLLALATNMYYVEGGLKWMNDIMCKAGIYKPEDFQLLVSVKNYNYLPSDISNFDIALIGSYKNLLSIDKVRNGVQVLKPVEKIEVDVIYNNFGIQIERIANRKFLKNNGVDIKQINILKACVGSGKTQKIIRQKNILIAVPNHKLKNELAERMKEAKIEFICTPETPNFNDRELNDKYKLYHDIGDSQKANQLIKDKAAEAISVSEDPVKNGKILQDIFAAQEYLRKLNECYSSDVTVITTHRRAILSHKNFKKDHIIFDEDIYKELLPMVSFKKSDLSKIIEDIHASERNKKLANEFEKDLRAVYSYLDTLPVSIIRPIENIIFFNERYFKEKILLMKGGEKIIKFLNSDFIVRHEGLDDKHTFYGIKKLDLLDETQVTIVSGTADKWIYDKLLNGREYDFHNLGTAKNLIEIKQYTGTAYTKKQIKEGNIPPIQENSVVITYQSEKDKFKNADNDVHFYNTSGFDHLKGENISIAGTPIPTPVVVMLYAKALGLEYSSQDKDYRTVIMENFSFPMYTYNDENLMNIEVRIAQMELTQAVGRSRSVRYKSQTELFSKVPIDTTDIFLLKK